MAANMDCISACVAVNSAVARTTSAIFRFVRHARESRSSLANLSAELYALDGIVTMLREDAAIYASPYADDARPPPAEDPSLVGDIARLTPVVVSASGVLVGALELLFHKYGKKHASDPASSAAASTASTAAATAATAASSAAVSPEPAESFASESWPVVKKFVAELRPGLEIYRLALGLSLDLSSLTNLDTPVSAFEPDISRILAEISHLRLRIRAACRDTQTVAVLQAYLDLLQRLAASSLERPPEPSIVHRLIPGNSQHLDDDDDYTADRLAATRRLHSYRSSGSLQTTTSSACPPIHELDHVLDDVLDHRHDYKDSNDLHDYSVDDRPPTPPPRSAARSSPCSPRSPQSLQYPQSPHSRPLRSHHHGSSSLSASAHEPLLDLDDTEPFPSMKPEEGLGRQDDGKRAAPEALAAEAEADAETDADAYRETQGPLTRRMTQAFGTISVSSSPHLGSTYSMTNIVTANSVDTASTTRTNANANALALNTTVTTTTDSSGRSSSSQSHRSNHSVRSNRTKSFDTPVTMSSIGSTGGSGGGSGGGGSGSGSAGGSGGGSAGRGTRAFWPFKKKNMAAVEASSAALSAAVGLTPPVSRAPSRRLSASLRALSTWTSGTASLDRSSSRASGVAVENAVVNDEDDEDDEEEERVPAGGAGARAVGGGGGESDIPEDGAVVDAVFGVALRKSIRVAGTTARTRHGGQGQGQSGGQGSSDGGGGSGGGSSSRRFPLCIFRCYQFLSENVNTPDLFGTENDEGLPLVDGRQLQRLRTAFSTGPQYGADLDVDLAVHGYTPHDAAALILQFLEELPRPLVSESVMKRWITLSRQATQAGDAGRMKHDEGLDFWAEALQGVGGLGLGFGFGGGGKKNNVSTAAASRNLLKLLLNLWGDIADAADTTNMTAERLAASVLRPLIHAPLATSRRSTDYMLALAFIIRRRSEYSQLLRGGRRKSRAAFEA